MEQIDLNDVKSDIGVGKGEFQSVKTDLENVKSSFGSIVPADSNEIPQKKDVQIEYDKTKTSQIKCLMNLLKGNVGTGILALPMAFRNAGLWMGVAGNMFLGFVALHCMHMLIRCNDGIRKRVNCEVLDYAGVAEACMETGPQCLRKYKRVGSISVNIFLVATQLGFCSVYIVFVAQNLRQIINSSDAADPSLDKIIMACEVIVMILFCTLVQSLEGLAYLSVLANVLQVTGLFIIMYNVCTDVPNIDTRPALGEWSTLPLYFGTAVYAFEGIGLVMPLKNKVQDEVDFGRKFGLLTLGMTIVIAFYIAIGFFGYLKYGDHVLGSITLNVPATGWLWKMTKMMFIVAIFITYGLQFYVPMSIIWPAVQVHLATDAAMFWVNIAIRVGIVIFTCIVAMVVPHLGLLISLVGALASTGLQYVFPPIIEMITFAAEGEELYCSTVIKDILILILGLTGMFTGTYTSLKGIIETM